jgi:predicted ferric reductase
MKRTIVGVFWIVLYLMVILSPLVVMVVWPTPTSRSFWVEFSLGLGFVGLVQIAVQFVLIARYQALTAPYGIDLILMYHRQIGFVAIALLVAHPILLVLENPALLALLNPLGGTTASRVGNGALYALILLGLVSVFRRQLGLSYELWRVSHALLGITALVLSHVHIHLAAHYTETPWKEQALIALSAVLVASFAYLRLVKPARLARAPYQVVAVTPEGGRTWSLAIAPRGHSGLEFRPGQFAWLKLGASAYTLDEHPFSFTSSAEARGRLEFGIKELGDFTNTIGQVALGTTVFVDGPHGAFSPDTEPAAGYVFFAGGAGIAPFISILRTMADRDDQRPITLFYGSRRWEATPYRGVIDALRTRLQLTVVHVLEEPPEDWTGETGFIDAGVLQRHLPRAGIERLHLLCGPGPMIESVEAALREHGVPMQWIQSERFDLV